MKLSNFISERDNAYNMVEGFYAHDTLVSSNDSLGNMLQRDPRLTAKYDLVYYMLEKNDATHADQLMNQIPQLFSLNALAQSEYNNYKQLYDLKRSLLSEGKNFLDLSEPQQELLLGVINQPSLSGSEMNDLNALRQVNVDDTVMVGKTKNKGLWLNYNEPILDPVVNPNKNAGYTEITDQEELQMEGLMDEVLMSENGLTLYPNPAVNEVNIFYNVADDAATISIDISDITGRYVGNYAVEKNNNVMKLNTQSFKKGVYYVMLTVDGKKQNVAKLVIQ